MLDIKKNITLFIILLIGFVLRLTAIFTDPFLHPWDERFHALVARNLMDHPLIPVLRANPVTDNYDKFIWCCNHVWLHKQPLFMWQMALSMKVFGVSEWSMRLPSAVMGTILIFLTYRIAILLTKNRTVALFSALMLAVSGFHLQLIAGMHGMDHNDVAHGYYVLASIWTYCEYHRNQKWYWVVLTGVFSGAAILNKWLTGLLVYLIWGVVILITGLQKSSVGKQVIHTFLSLFFCFPVFLPWQIYILDRFPDLANFVYDFNKRHITEALEGHTGDNSFYLDHLVDLIGKYLYYFIPVGLLLSFIKKEISGRLNAGIIAGMLFVFWFFSVFVKTKVDTYVFFIVPLGLIYISLGLNYIFEKLGKSRLVLAALVLATVYLSLNPSWFINYLSPQNNERNIRIYNTEIYKALNRLLPPNVKTVVNMNEFEDIDVMFYNEGITAYHFTMTEQDFEELKVKQIPVGIFIPHGKYIWPKYVEDYPYLYPIDQELKNLDNK
ncbi:MAG TPA: glycosyltransferase family 39 protein [Saprospiraceae bacterium]|nr:glycosyltransferase family 39 protein [Saprospiraceae bacterium]HNT19377.1 glycosyltransferase family 39 protein [Saprospiraceae bacterium]